MKYLLSRWLNQLVWPDGVCSQLGALPGLWTRVLSFSPHDPFHGLFGLLSSLVDGLPRVSILREQAERHGIFITYLESYKVSISLYSLGEALTKACPGLRGEGVDSTS